MRITTQLSMKEEKEIPNECSLRQPEHLIISSQHLDINDEHKRIMLLNLLHSRLRIQWPIITFAYTVPNAKGTSNRPNANPSFKTLFRPFQSKPTNHGSTGYTQTSENL